ncbi:MAG: phosphotransferase, partial [Thermomicrobiales bacterium]
MEPPRLSVPNEALPGWLADQFGLPELGNATIARVQTCGLSAAAGFRVSAPGDESFYLKVFGRTVSEAAARAPRAAAIAGVPNVVAPLAMPDGAVIAALPGSVCGAALYPWVTGQPADTAGLSSDQWRELGRTLRTLHDSRLEERLLGHIPTCPATYRHDHLRDLMERCAA